ncbi:uncharacterized protein LOC118151663 [Callithrix jacchus]|uniref:uncharacterized protein LOC118151663 n=1 Tax=Callithrix jacchus TaxID=9483 RepID=UPI00159DCDCB|nr:uncharacterized protein LOC118151663 [Callithrix jacchus]
MTEVGGEEAQRQRAGEVSKETWGVAPSLEGLGGDWHSRSRHCSLCKSKAATPPSSQGAWLHFPLSPAERGPSPRNAPPAGVLHTPKRNTREQARVGGDSGGAAGLEGLRRPATRACADPGTRPFTYRWNHEAPFPGRSRFSRTRGDCKRARTEAPSGSAAGKPLPGAAVDGRLKRRLWRGASPVSDPRIPPAVVAAETRKRRRECRLKRRLRCTTSLTASGRRAAGGGRAGCDAARKTQGAQIQSFKGFGIFNLNSLTTCRSMPAQKIAATTIQLLPTCLSWKSVTWKM